MKKRRSTPPKWMDKLLSLICKDDVLENVQGDLHEIFYDRVERQGERKAKNLFIRDAMGLLRPRLVKKMEGQLKLNQYGMLRNHITSSFRSIKSNLINSLINLFGMGFAISVCLAIALFAIHEFTYDHYHEKADRIVRLFDMENSTSSFDYRVKDILKENFPQIEEACLVQQFNSTSDIMMNGETEAHLFDVVMSADKAFFKVFSVPLILGDDDRPFHDKNSVVLTEKTARRFFKNVEEAMGKVLTFQNSKITVTGVVKDFPENSSFSPEFILNSENEKFRFEFICEDYQDKSSHRWPFRTYIQLQEGTQPDELIGLINLNVDLLEGLSLPQYDGATTTLGLLPLKEMYLYDNTTGSRAKKGNLFLLKILVTIAILVLSLAIVNYVNLTLAQQIRRNKTNIIRKTLGAGRRTVFIQIVIESLIIITLGAILGLLLLWVTNFVYSASFQVELDILVLFSFPYFLFFLAGLFLVGLISGVLPALVFSKVHPSKIFGGLYLEKRKKSILTNGLSVFQLAASIVLIISVSVIYGQISFVKHKDPGFSEDQLVRFDVKNTKYKDVPSMLSLIKELKQLPSVKNVSITKGAPGQVGMMMGPNIPGANKESVSCIFVDTLFLEAFEIELVRGRNILPGEMGKVCFINEAAYEYFEFENLDNKTFNNGRTGGYKIIGVVNDFNFSSFHNEIEPLCIMVSMHGISEMNIRLAGNISKETFETIEAKFEEFLPHWSIEYEFYDYWFDRQFQKEERLARLITLFALFALIISCIGILGLTIFKSENQTKEIAIRKVLGASVSQILALINSDFVKWNVIAFLIACPIGYWAMRQWLDTFAFKIDFAWWIFVLAGLITVTLSMLISSWHSLKTALGNPVNSLRNE